MATDQELRDAGLLYIPKQKYLQNPYNLPVKEETAPVESGGITNADAFTNSGSNYSVFNPDPNSIVNRNYKPNYDYRQYEEINSKTFNPQPFTNPNQLGVKNAQLMYNKAAADLADPFNRLAETETFTGIRPSKEVMDFYGEKILDNQERYRTQGQFVDPYDPRYSSVTEAQKFMDNFPEYYNEPPPSKMEGILKALPYVGTLTRGAKFLGDQIGPYLPVNRRSILENELGGKGIMVNDIGQIVQGEGAYDTAANVMAGYNASRMTADTFDKRIASLGNMSVEGRKKREAAIEAAKKNFLDAQTRTDKIFDFEEAEKEKKKKDTIVGRYITKRKEKKAAKDAKDAEDAAKKADETLPGNYPTGRSYDAPGGVGSSDYNQAANVASGGGGDTARNAQGQTAREATYDGNKNTGTSQGYSQHYARGGRAGYFFGGRVNYKIGGRVGFKNGGLADLL